jgi:hypothetical protein
MRASSIQKFLTLMSIIKPVIYYNITQANWCLSFYGCNIPHRELLFPPSGESPPFDMYVANPALFCDLPLNSASSAKRLTHIPSPERERCPPWVRLGFNYKKDKGAGQYVACHH